MIPIAFAGALVGGVGIASRSVADGGSVFFLEAALPWLAAVVGSELLFRGLVYGQIVWAFGPISTSTSTARSEREARLAPALFAGLLSTAVGLLFASQSSPVVVPPANLAQAPLVLAGSLTVGLAAGLARERSESVLGAIAVYGVSALVLALPSLPSLG
jgi:membrane protease YdiL (CAAX protease family)